MYASKKRNCLFVFSLYWKIYKKQEYNELRHHKEVGSQDAEPRNRDKTCQFAALKTSKFMRKTPCSDPYPPTLCKNGVPKNSGIMAFSGREMCHFVSIVGRLGLHRKQKLPRE